MHNENSFLDRTGVAAGLTFIDEELRFIVLSHNGGNEANLFRTSDGGLTFEQVELPSVSVTQNGAEFEPFDFPEPPIESNGKLTLYVNQGTDGDRSEEHTSELQSRFDLVCRLLLEKKNMIDFIIL